MELLDNLYNEKAFVAVGPSIGENTFFVILLGKAMNSDASSDKEYGPTELDHMIQDQFFDLSDSDEEMDMIMLMIMQEEMDRQVKYK